MTRSVSAWLQVLLLAVLVGAATLLWLARDQVGDAVASFAKTESEQGKKPSKSGRARKVPVIVARVEQARNVEVIAGRWHGARPAFGNAPGQGRWWPSSRSPRARATGYSPAT